MTQIKNPQPVAEGLIFGAPGEIRTPDQVVRSHLLYPAELRVLEMYKVYLKLAFEVLDFAFDAIPLCRIWCWSFLLGNIGPYIG